MVSYSRQKTPRPHVANPALSAELGRYERTPIIERNAPFEPAAERPVRSPIQRLAALLSAISRNNTYEGRNACQIPDTLTATFVANLLAIDVADLPHLLGVLKHQGLVDIGPTNGLLLLDVDGIERLAA